MTPFLALIVVGYGVVFAGGELARSRGVSPELTRKTAHILGGILSALLPWATTQAGAIFIAFFFSGTLWLAYRFGYLRSIHAARSEARGAIFFPLGLGLAALFCWDPPIVFASSALMLGLADGLAGLAGRIMGRHSYSLTGPKTLEGSAAFLITALAILWATTLALDLPITLERGLNVFLVALIVTASEGAAGRGTDNLIISPTTALLIRWLIL